MKKIIKNSTLYENYEVEKFCIGKVGNISIENSIWTNKMWEEDDEGDDFDNPFHILIKKTIGLIYKTYWVAKKSSRKYTANTKTKSEVRGSGRKPWRQKGTGRARAGSIRSPLWVGGGVSFGPKPHVVKKKINKKERFLAFWYAFLLKTKKIFCIDDKYFNLGIKLKTKDIVSQLKFFKIDFSKKTLLILPDYNRRVYFASRNIKNLIVTTIRDLNLVDLVDTEFIISTPLVFSKEN